MCVHTHAHAHMYTLFYSMVFDVVDSEMKFSYSKSPQETEVQRQMTLNMSG